MQILHQDGSHPEPWHLITKDNQTALEGTPGTSLLRSPDDVIDVIGACFENKTRSVLLYAENLTEHFFDLSSGEAGTILQKLRNYHIKLAVVISPGGMTRHTDRFREMAREESRGNDFHIFDDRASAEAWLLHD